MKNIPCLIGLNYEKILACPNDCVLYRGELLHWWCVQHVGYHNFNKLYGSSGEEETKGPLLRCCGTCQ